MKIWKSGLTVITLALSTSVEAAFIDRDYVLSNDTLLTFDNQTGLEWLDITATENMSADNALTQYSDFRIATRNEFEQLLTNAGFTYLNSGQFNYDFVDAPAAEDLLNHIGITFDAGFEQILAGNITDGASLDLYAVRNHQSGGASTYFLDANNSFVGSQSDLGIFLVRTSLVPIPAAVWLFGSGLIGLIGVARRKKA